MNIINNSEVLGSLGKDLVLNTLGKVYIRVGDRYYELDFRKEIKDFEEEVAKDANNEGDSNVIIVKNYKHMDYPGDGKLIISLDGKFVVTQNGIFKDVTPSSKNIYNAANVTISLIEDANVIGKLYSDNLILDFMNGDISADEIIANKLTVKTLSAESINVPAKDRFVSGSNKLYIGPEISVYKVVEKYGFTYFYTQSDATIFPINETITNSDESFIGEIVESSDNYIKARIIQGDPSNSDKVILIGDYIEYSNEGKSIYNKSQNIRFKEIKESGDYSDIELATICSNLDIILKHGTFLKCISDCKINVTIDSVTKEYFLNENTLYLINKSECIPLTTSILYFDNMSDLNNANIDNNTIAFIKETSQIYYKGIFVGKNNDMSNDFDISNALDGALIVRKNNKWQISYDYVTDEYVTDKLNKILNNAPDALDTLGEIADALQNNVNSIGDIIFAINNISKKIDDEINKINNKINNIDIDNISVVLSNKASIDELRSLENKLSNYATITNVKYAFDDFRKEVNDSIKNIDLKHNELTSFIDKYKNDVSELKSIDQNLINKDAELLSNINNIYLKFNDYITEEKFNETLSSYQKVGVSLYKLSEINIDKSSLTGGEIIIYDNISNSGIATKSTDIGINETSLNKYLQDNEYLTKTIADNLYSSIENFNNLNSRVTTIEDIIVVGDDGNIYISGLNSKKEYRNLIVYGSISFGGAGDSSGSGTVIGSTVEYKSNVNNGKLLGTIIIDGKSNNIYAPVIPTTLSAFANDVSYVTENTLDDRGYLTQSDAENTYATKTALNETAANIKALESTLKTEQGYIDTLQSYFDNDKAKKAIADGDGNNIVDIYATKKALSTTNTSLDTLNEELKKFKESVNNLWYPDPDHADTIRTKFNVIVDKAISFGGYGESSGSDGGITQVTKQMVVDALGYTPYDSANPKGYVTSTTFNALAERVSSLENTNKPCSLEDVIGIDENGDVYIKKSGAVARNFYTYGAISFGGFGESSEGGGGLTTFNVVLNGTTYASNGATVTITEQLASKSSVNSLSTRVSALESKISQLQNLWYWDDVNKAVRTSNDVVIDKSISFGGVGNGSTSGGGGLTAFDVVINGITYSSSGATVTVTEKLATQSAVTTLSNKINGYDSRLTALEKLWHWSDEHNAVETDHDVVVKKAISFGGYGESSGSGNGGLTKFTVKVGNVAYESEGGVVSLPAYPTVPSLSGYAKETWVSGNYLPLAGGGEISSPSFAPLSIKRNSDSGAAAIAYKGKTGEFGYIGFNNTSGPKWFDTSFTEYTIIHSANISSQSVKYAESAGKLSTASAYTAWGQTFFQNGLPNSISGDMTGVGSLTMNGILTLSTTKISEKTKNNTKYLEVDGNLVVTGSVSFGGYGESNSGGSGGITSITYDMVVDALGYTPYNSANFTKANIKSTLGISDWALAVSKPTYSKSDVGLGNVKNIAVYTRELGVNGANWTFASTYYTTDNKSTSIYAPTSAGAAGQYLVSNGSGAPYWHTIDPYDYNIRRDANTVLAAPSGYNDSATFRKLVSDDIPSLDWSKITSGKPTTVSGYGITDAITTSNIGSQSVNYATSAGSATKLTNTRTIGGKSFDGSSNVSGALTEVYSITPDTAHKYSCGTSDKPWNVVYTRYIDTLSSYDLRFRTGGTEQMRLAAASGCLIIGDSNALENSAYKLDVQGVVRAMNSSDGSGVIIANEGNTIDGYYNGWGNLYLNHTSSGNVNLVVGGGNVGIGTTNPSSKLHIAGDVTLSDTTGSASKSYKLKFLRRTDTDDYWDYGIYAQSTKGLTFYQSSEGINTDIAYLTGEGNFVVNGSITFGSASDRRLKDNIKSMTDKQAVAVLSALNPVTFEWNTLANNLDSQLKGFSDGFIADEYEKLIPNSGRDIWANYRAINYERATGYLVKGWQNHETRLEKAERRIKELENELKQYRRV